MFLNSILICHGVLCGRNYQINEHAQNIFFKRIFWNKTFSIIRSSTRFIEERVASIAASNVSIASNMDQSFKGPLRFLLLLAYG